MACFICHINPGTCSWQRCVCVGGGGTSGPGIRVVTSATMSSWRPVTGGGYWDPVPFSTFINDRDACRSGTLGRLERLWADRILTELYHGKKPKSCSRMNPKHQEKAAGAC